MAELERAQRDRAKRSPDAALRDINGLLALGVRSELDGGGRKTAGALQSSAN